MRTAFDERSQNVDAASVAAEVQSGGVGSNFGFASAVLVLPIGTVAAPVLRCLSC
jgi:hypothetical protein